MLFNSLQFLFFFPVVTALYFILPHRMRCALLLAASCLFYMAFRPVYILILVFTIAVDYVAGLLLVTVADRWRKPALLASLTANLGVLCFFKYYGFLNEVLQKLLFLPDRPLPVLDIILPIGLSFHVFQSLSYTIEVYRRRVPAERNPMVLAVYVLFYPQLVAGPIERPQNLLPQFHERHSFSYENMVVGLQLMLWGFFKKVVIADRLAPFVSQVFDNPYDYSGPALFWASALFAFQVFCDFSGYSDIATGAARCMGFRLMTNFDRPLFAASMSEFWKRWHISLSSWFRDYVYIPLGGSRVDSRWRLTGNLFITFLLSGLWHGANWTYLIWGALHGLYVSIEVLLGLTKHKAPVHNSISSHVVHAFHVVRTFTLFAYSLAIFRARNTEDALYIMGHIFTGWVDLAHAAFSRAYIKSQIFLGQGAGEFMIVVAVLICLLVIQSLHGSRGLTAFLSRQPVWLRWGFYYAAAFGVMFFGAFNRSQQFIYFQF